MRVAHRAEFQLLAVLRPQELARHVDAHHPADVHRARAVGVRIRAGLYELRPTVRLQPGVPVLVAQFVLALELAGGGAVLWRPASVHRRRPGDNTTCTYRVTEADARNDHVTNVAFATAENGTVGSNQDAARIAVKKMCEGKYCPKPPKPCEGKHCPRPPKPCHDKGG
ncbi:hypothetical protein ACF1A9_26795 [Streptomyces sp. NPDC014872]|uniref:hypothetical protein n=1 Tax=Streptomyces sp. NPDC014872 TaxID=3364926 RepID=UPI0036FF66DE